MAKRKKPISIFNLPKEEVMKASSDIISSTQKEPSEAPKPKETKKEPTPSKSQKKPVEAPKKAPKRRKTAKLEPTGKRKFLYVDEVHHQSAKINAAMKGMKLQDYIAWLIINDTNR